MLCNKKTGKQLSAEETLEFFNQVRSSIENIFFYTKDYINNSTKDTILSTSKTELDYIQTLLKNSVRLISDQVISKEPEGSYGVWSEPIVGQIISPGWLSDARLSYNQAMWEADRMNRANKAWHYSVKPVLQKEIKNESI